MRRYKDFEQWGYSRISVSPESLTFSHFHSDDNSLADQVTLPVGRHVPTPPAPPPVTGIIALYSTMAVLLTLVFGFMVRWRVQVARRNRYALELSSPSSEGYDTLAG